MTLEEIDKEIALFCGWGTLEKLTNDLTWAEAWLSPIGNAIQWDPPKYSSDLNLMREAEQILFARYHDAKDIFVDLLSRIMDPVFGCWKDQAVDIIDATAEQHARAFVETIKQIKS